MLRHFPQPLHTGILHRCIGVQTFGDGMTDHRLSFFFQQPDQGLLFFDQGVDFGGFVIEEVSMILCLLSTLKDMQNVNVIAVLTS